MTQQERERFEESLASLHAATRRLRALLRLDEDPSIRPPLDILGRMGL